MEKEIENNDEPSGKCKDADLKCIIKVDNEVKEKSFGLHEKTIKDKTQLDQETKLNVVDANNKRKSNSEEQKNQVKCF